MRKSVSPRDSTFDTTLMTSGTNEIRMNGLGIPLKGSAALMIMILIGSCDRSVRAQLIASDLPKYPVPCTLYGIFRPSGTCPEVPFLVWYFPIVANTPQLITSTARTASQLPVGGGIAQYLLRAGIIHVQLYSYPVLFKFVYLHPGLWGLWYGCLALWIAP